MANIITGGRKAADKTYFFNQSSCSKRSHWMRRVHCTKTFEGNTFCHTLLISPPGCGKTTYLRDIIRLLSDGTDTITGKNVAVVDERSEIGNRTREGIGFYLGNRTDLMDHCPKAAGMLMMLRTMTPEILAADEIGGEKILRQWHMYEIVAVVY